MTTESTSPITNESLLIRLSPNDNVLVLTSSLPTGSKIQVDGVERILESDLALGHKIAACDIQKGEKIYKCHFPIGSATTDIKTGDHVHLHNMQSDYLPTYDRGETT